MKFSRNAGEPAKGYPLTAAFAIQTSLRKCVPLLFAALISLSASAREVTLVCLGDSLTEGYGVAPEESYPSVLERRLREDGLEVRVLNAGISGSTSASGLSRLRWQLRAEPDLLLLALGANDGLRGIDPAATRRNLARVLELARDLELPVVLAGMRLPPNYGPEHVKAFEALFPSLAEEYGVPLVPFLLEGVAARPELNLADGIHPTARGYQRVVDNLLPVVRPLLEGMTP